MVNSGRDVTEGAHRDEVSAVIERYAKRDVAGPYSILRPEVLLSQQELQRGILQMLASTTRRTGTELNGLRLIDVGCGFGGHLLDFLRFGLTPGNLSGIELLPDRFAAARARLPGAVQLHHGDANSAAVAPQSQDVVFQSVVFSSFLDDAYQQSLAERMWSWLRDGGGVLWYDFVYNNPRNPDVRGVPIKRVRQLFPRAAAVVVKRITLAPPISRFVCRMHPSFYHMLNVIPLLRTHVLCWIAKANA